MFMTRSSFPNSLWRLRTPVPSLLGKSKPQESREGGRGTENEYTAIKGKKKKKRRRQADKEGQEGCFFSEHRVAAEVFVL